MSDRDDSFGDDATIQGLGPTMASVDDEGKGDVTSAFEEDLDFAIKLVGTVLNKKYELKDLIGQGGMGAVYEARHVEIGSRFAVKVLFPDKRRKRESLARFRREAQAAGNIDHPNVAKVFDLGRTEEGISFLVMDFVEGKSLAEVIAREKRMAPERVIEVACQVLDALDAAHAQGIIHRDIKPENVMVGRDAEGGETIKVLDFGISKMRPMDSETQGLTQTGTILGTPMYMAPEQARGEPDLDHRIDLYAVGAMMYVMLSGTSPFQASNYNALLAKILTEEPPPIDTVVEGLQTHLRLVVAKAMARDRGHRFASAREFIGALRGQPVELPQTAATEVPSLAEVEQRPASSRAIWVGVGLASVVGAAVALLLGSGALSGASDGNTGLGAGPVVRGADDAELLGAPTPKLRPAPAVKIRDAGNPTDGGPGDALSKMISLELTTDPAEATITVNGEPHESPLKAQFLRTAREKLQVVVEAEGYETKQLFLPRTEDIAEQVTLERKIARPHRGKRPAGHGGNFKIAIE